MEQIPPQAIKAALSACRRFRNDLDMHGVSVVHVLGTAALRRAANAPTLIEGIEAVLCEPVRVIDGETEAALIARGAMLPLKPSPVSRLVVDIGGGSVEFILFSRQEAVWSRSYDVGVAVLKHLFHIEDPIRVSGVNALNQFLDKELQELMLRVAREESLEIVGAAGIFEVLARLIGEPYHRSVKAISPDRLSDLTRQVSHMGKEERHADPRIPQKRSEHIVVALLLVEWLMSRLPVSKLLCSPFSMKEGALVTLGERLNLYPLPRSGESIPSGHPHEAS